MVDLMEGFEKDPTSLNYAERGEVIDRLYELDLVELQARGEQIARDLGAARQIGDNHAIARLTAIEGLYQDAVWGKELEGELAPAVA